MLKKIVHIFKKIAHLIIAICLMIFAYFLLRGDLLPFLQWWLLVLLLGISYMPLTSKIFETFHDQGYLFSKVIGIAITGYLMWLLSSLRILKFTQVSCVIALVLGLLLNLVLFLIRKKYASNSNKSIVSSNISIDTKLLRTLATEELIFFALFLIFIYIKAFKPEAYGTEKFMDYGFMTSMMRSDYMPPQDFWFSGTNLNYYYVGQFMATFLTKLSFVKVSHGYNLMLMMIAALAVVLPYSLVYNLILGYSKVDGNAKGKVKKMMPTIGGVIAGIGVCLAGNMHYPVYKWFIPIFRKVMGMEPSNYHYWFPDATRYIGYNPETNDKTIHEFPAYSFVLGDLHAHVINIMFVLTLLGILMAWQNSRRNVETSRVPIWKELFQPYFILIGFYIGIFHTTNFWDFPIYFVVSGAIILFSNMVVYNFSIKSLWLTLLQGIVILGISELVCFPFTLNFDQISSKIRMAVNHTPLYQLIILWGLPITMVTSFLIFSISAFRRNNRKTKENKITEDKLGLFRFMEELKPSDLFIITIGLCAIGLILMPELIYVQDIYSGDYKRANTMFKLTYQAFIMFGICFGYIFVRMIAYGQTKRQRSFGIVGLILFVMTIFYTGNATKAWFGDVFNRDRYKGIDAAAFMETEMPDDYLATKWLNENISGNPVVLEANGDSYTDYQRVSVITGLPTVLGWRTHEWLWKSNPQILDVRAADIQTIYTSTNEDEVRDLISFYNISYIYVGKLELEKFENVNHQLIKSLGTVVFSIRETEDKSYETYIVKLNR